MISKLWRCFTFFFLDFFLHEVLYLYKNIQYQSENNKIKCLISFNCKNKIKLQNYSISQYLFDFIILLYET